MIEHTTTERDASTCQGASFDVAAQPGQAILPLDLACNGKDVDFSVCDDNTYSLLTLEEREVLVVIGVISVSVQELPPSIGC